MKREIKFRAWMDDGNEIMADYERWGEVEDFWMMVRKHEFPVMQFTGLTDRNGVEIYEGDVVSAVPTSGYVDHICFKGKDRELWLVRWDYDGYTWECLGDDKRYASEQDIREGGMHHGLYKHEGVLLEEKEVIGNIYENPDFLQNPETKVRQPAFSDF